jgi:hypothetical protein
MATREHRLAEFNSAGDPPPDQLFELLSEDHNGTYLIPFLCHWSNGTWKGVESDTPIQGAVVGWRTKMDGSI